jgi:hypothetical protein
MEDTSVQPIKILVAAALFSALLGGCKGNAAPATVTATATEAVAPASATASDPLVASTPAAVMTTAAPSPTASSAGVRSAAPGVAEPAAMYATDPATVDLASGELQFIKFFAFW